MPLSFIFSEIHRNRQRIRSSQDARARLTDDKRDAHTTARQ
jgi:hypothetical protein